MFHSAAELGEKALVNLGFSKYEAYRSTRTFKHHEEQVLEELYELWKTDKKHFIRESRRFSEQLSETLQAEKNYSIHETDSAWGTSNIVEETKLKNESDKNQ